MEWYFSLSGLFNAITSTLLGLFVFFKNRHSKINKTFALFCFCVAAWSYPYIFWPLAETKSATLFWFQLLHIGPFYASIAYLHFVSTWLGIYQKIKKVVISGYFLATFFLVFVFSPLFIKNMVPKFSMRFWAEPGILYHFYLLLFFGFAFYSSYLLLTNYNKTKGSKRAQIKYILVGMFLAYIGGSTNYLLWYNINCPPFGNILASSYVIFTAYAIVAHHLMDIKLVLRNSFAYLAPLVTVLVGYTFVQYITNLYLADWIITTSNVAVLILSILFFIPLKNFYYHLANKYFFSSLYDSQEVLANLSEKLRSSLDTKIICDLISKTLINAFHSKATGILIFDEKKNRYAVEYNYNFNIGAQKYFPNDKFLQNKFAGQNKILIVENTKNNLSYKKSQSTLELLNKLGIEILAPLNIKNKTIGLIVLGSKESNDMYNDEDLKVLQVVGAQTAVALQNSLRYQESLRFSEKLKQEVKVATQDLRKANQKLKILDKAKTEFISITSHQLRTPLTGIKGYLSMFLEGDFGALKTQQKKIITDVFNNSNRLVRLINIFLNVSRIESGRLKLQKSKFNLTELINEIIRELKIEAEKKNLKLEFSAKGGPVSGGNNLDISADRDKIADVILNLVDNAIKYTEKGNVIVSAELKNNNIKVSIKDSGIGINPEEAKILFNKFIRGRKIAEINTSGSGLGLFIAKKIIELHNGKIWVESKGQGKGSEFIFEIPVK